VENVNLAAISPVPPRSFALRLTEATFTSLRS